MYKKINNHNKNISIISICQNRILLTMVFIFLFFNVSCATQPELIINDTNRAPYTTEDGKGYLNIIINKVSQKANIKISLVRQPPERGLKNANSGEIDGDLTRIIKVGLLYPNLVRVEEKLLDWKFAAFSRSSSYISDWSMMKDHSVGYIKGWKIYENKTKDFKKTMIAMGKETRMLLMPSNGI